MIQCAIPNCDLPAVADFRVGDHVAPQCAMHGYLVLSQLGGQAYSLHDHIGFDQMLTALRKDGFVVATDLEPLQ